MGNKRILKNNQKGQTTVEYVLLIFVVVSITVGIMKSAYFRKLFAPDGSIAMKFKTVLESSYRHGYRDGDAKSTYNNYSGRHDSYANGAETRFFIPQENYPE